MGHGRSQVTAQPSPVLNTGTVSIPGFREKEKHGSPDLGSSKEEVRIAEKSVLGPRVTGCVSHCLPGYNSGDPVPL